MYTLFFFYIFINKLYNLTFKKGKLIIMLDNYKYIIIIINKILK